MYYFNHIKDVNIESELKLLQKRSLKPSSSQIYSYKQRSTLLNTVLMRALLHGPRRSLAQAE